MSICALSLQGLPQAKSNSFLSLKVDNRMANYMQNKQVLAHHEDLTRLATKLTKRGVVDAAGFTPTSFRPITTVDLKLSVTSFSKACG